MKNFTTNNILTRELESITCDVCEREYFIDEVMELQEFVSIEMRTGYLSIFGDDRQLEIDICQHCLSDKLGEYLRIEE